MSRNVAVVTTKHVDRRNVGLVVVQKGPPGRGGEIGTPRHPPPNCGLADLDAGAGLGMKAEADRDAVAAGRSPDVAGQ